MKLVKRLLQLGTWLILMATFLTPLSECFDHWDSPGIANDTEFALFVFALSLVLVLIVSRLISALCLAFRFAVLSHLFCEPDPRLASAEATPASSRPPLSLAPLRI
jgi:hypothetical protein